MLRSRAGIWVLTGMLRLKGASNTNSPGPKNCSFVKCSAQELCKENGRGVQGKSNLAGMREGLKVH